MCQKMCQNIRRLIWITVPNKIINFALLQMGLIHLASQMSSCKGCWLAASASSFPVHGLALHLCTYGRIAELACLGHFQKYGIFLA